MSIGILETSSVKEIARIGDRLNRMRYVVLGEELKYAVSSFIYERNLDLDQFILGATMAARYLANTPDMPFKLNEGNESLNLGASLGLFVTKENDDMEYDVNLMRGKHQISMLLKSGEIDENDILTLASCFLLETDEKAKWFVDDLWEGEYKPDEAVYITDIATVAQKYDGLEHLPQSTHRKRIFVKGNDGSIDDSEWQAELVDRAEFISDLGETKESIAVDNGLTKEITEQLREADLSLLNKHQAEALAIVLRNQGVNVPAFINGVKMYDNYLQKGLSKKDHRVPSTHASAYYLGHGFSLVKSRDLHAERYDKVKQRIGEWIDQEKTDKDTLLNLASCLLVVQLPIGIDFMEYTINSALGESVGEIGVKTIREIKAIIARRAELDTSIPRDTGLENLSEEALDTKMFVNTEEVLARNPMKWIEQTAARARAMVDITSERRPEGISAQVAENMGKVVPLSEDKTVLLPREDQTTMEGPNNYYPPRQRHDISNITGAMIDIVKLWVTEKSIHELYELAKTLEELKVEKKSRERKKELLKDLNNLSQKLFARSSFMPEVKEEKADLELYRQMESFRHGVKTLKVAKGMIRRTALPAELKRKEEILKVLDDLLDEEKVPSRPIRSWPLSERNK